MPLPRREDFDAAGQAIFDASVYDPRSIVGLRGPGGIRMHNPKLTELSQPLNRYLRFEAGLDRRLVEITILATALEVHSDFEWCAHEGEARKLGVPQSLIDTIRTRGPLDGVPEADAALIRLVRETVGAHRLSSQTYADALRLFGRTALLNYVALIGNYLGTAVMLTAFDMQLPEGTTSPL